MPRLLPASRADDLGRAVVELLQGAHLDLRVPVSRQPRARCAEIRLSFRGQPRWSWLRHLCTCASLALLRKASGHAACSRRIRRRGTLPRTVCWGFQGFFFWASDAQALSGRRARTSWEGSGWG